MRLVELLHGVVNKDSKFPEVATYLDVADGFMKVIFYSVRFEKM